MNVTLHNTPDSFDKLASSWTSLFTPTRSDQLFLSNTWQKSWWNNLSRGELAIITIEDQQEIIGIAPLFIEEHHNLRTIRFIGCVDVVDYLDFLIKPEKEEKFIQALFEFLLSDTTINWDTLDLCNIPANSPTIPALENLAPRYQLKVTNTIQEVCPVITLPKSYDDYLANINKKQRHELKRKRRKAEGSEEIDWFIARSEQEIKEYFPVFVDLMTRSTPEKADFLKVPGHTEFFQEVSQTMASSGWMELMFLTINGEPIASGWQFAYQDRILLYNSGIDNSVYGHLSPGIVLLTYGIEDAINRGFNYYDFLRGDETYKFRMGAKETTIHNLKIER